MTCKFSNIWVLSVKFIKLRTLSCKFQSKSSVYTGVCKTRTGLKDNETAVFTRVSVNLQQAWRTMKHIPTPPITALMYSKNQGVRT